MRKPKPDSVWYAGRWRSPQGIVRHRRAVREAQRNYRSSPKGAMTNARRRIKQKEARSGEEAE